MTIYINLYNINTYFTFLIITGTGKTATFSISILQQIDTNIKECQALILAPTRELAQQVRNILHASFNEKLYLEISRKY